MEIRDSKAGFVLKILHEVASETDDNIDVEVVLAGGERYTATFVTFANVKTTLARYRGTGECLAGKYFWIRNPIFVEDLNPKTIQNVVRDLLQNGELFGAFDGPHVD